MSDAVNVCLRVPLSVTTLCTVLLIAKQTARTQRHGALVLILGVRTTDTQMYVIQLASLRVLYFLFYVGTFFFFFFGRLSLKSIIDN